MISENKIEGLGASLKEYLKIQYQLMTLRLTEKFSESGSSLASIVILTVVFLISILFLSLAAGFYLSRLFESYVNGFMIVGAFYFLLLLILMAFRKKILRNPAKDKIICALLKENTN